MGSGKTRRCRDAVLASTRVGQSQELIEGAAVLGKGGAPQTRARSEDGPGTNLPGNSLKCDPHPPFDAAGLLAGDSRENQDELIGRVADAGVATSQLAPQRVRDAAQQPAGIRSVFIGL